MHLTELGTRRSVLLNAYRGIGTPQPPARNRSWIFQPAACYRSAPRRRVNQWQFGHCGRERIAWAAHTTRIDFRLGPTSRPQSETKSHRSRAARYQRMRARGLAARRRFLSVLRLRFEYRYV